MALINYFVFLMRALSELCMDDTWCKFINLLLKRHSCGKVVVVASIKTFEWSLWSPDGITVKDSRAAELAEK